MNRHNRLQTILDEYRSGFESLNTASITLLASRIASAGRIFILGAGRTRCVTQMFAMRLTQTGLTTYMVGDVTTPAITGEDLLLCASGSGETAGIINLTRKALASSPETFCITANPQSTLSSLCDNTLLLPSPESNTQILGNFTETSLLLTLDQVVEELLEQTGTSPSILQQNHANIE